MPLNNLQKELIDGVLKFIFESCFSPEISSEVGLTALKAMVSPTLSKMKTLENSDMRSEVQFVRDILEHRYPQNRKVGDLNANPVDDDGFPLGEDGVYQGIVYYLFEGMDGEKAVAFEPQGLLGLTAKNDETTSTVTRKDVQTYVKHKIYLEIYKLNCNLQNTDWYLHSFEEEVSCKYVLEREQCKIVIVAPKNLSKKSDKVQLEKLQTVISALIKDSDKMRNVTKKLELGKTINFFREGGNAENALVQFNIENQKAGGCIELGRSFIGRDPTMAQALDVLNQYVFDGEIPLFLLNFLRDATGQELIEYDEHVPYYENFGSFKNRKNKIFAAIGFLPLAVISIIHDFDYSASNDAIHFVATLRDKAMSRLNRENVDQVLMDLQHAAQYGDLDAAEDINYIGKLFYVGNSIFTEDNKFAAEIFKKAADLGSLDGLYNLGLLYFEGKGVQKNLKCAAELFKQATVLGHRPALSQLYVLGNMFFWGKEISQDLKLAEELFKQAAELGIKEAAEGLNAIACLYIEGREVPGDLNKAAELFKHAAVLGFRQAVSKLVSLGGIYFKGENAPQDLKRAAELFKQAADLGDPVAKYELGLSYLEGTGVQKDLKRAAGLFKEAGQLGVQEAAEVSFIIGCLYYEGREVPKDLNQATELFKQAALLGHKQALSNLNALGKMYLHGEEVPQDLKHAVELFKQAADLGDPIAKYNLGAVYENGIGVPQDLKRAAELFKQAADLGDAAAKNNLDVLYRNGIGVQRDSADPVPPLIFTQVCQDISIAPQDANIECCCHCEPKAKQSRKQA